MSTTTATTKVTKRDHLNALLNMIADVADAGWDGYDFEALTAFCTNEIEHLDNKSAKAKAAAAAKKAEKDELCAVVESLLTDEFQTREDFAAQIEGDDVSAAKVGARLTKLVNLGIAEKGEVTVPGTDGQKKRVLTGYKLVLNATEA